MPNEDEIAGVCSAIGASFAGNLAVTSTSGPGLALKSEAGYWSGGYGRASRYYRCAAWRPFYRSSDRTDRPYARRYTVAVANLRWPWLLLLRLELLLQWLSGGLAV